MEDNTILKFWNIKEINDFIKNGENKSKNMIPIYNYQNKNKISELITLEDNLLCGCLIEKGIFIYKYDIHNNSSQIIKESDICAKNIKLIKMENKKYICGKDKNYLIIIEIPTLIIKENIKLGNWEGIQFCYEQINKDEIIIGNGNRLQILNLNKNKIKYTQKINLVSVMSITKLKDNTILIGGRSEIKRYFLKQFKELPKIINLENNDDEFDDDDFDYNLLGAMLSRDEKDVLSISEWSNGCILANLKYNINLYGLEDIC